MSELTLISIPLEAILKDLAAIAPSHKPDPVRRISEADPNEQTQPPGAQHEDDYHP